MRNSNLIRLLCLMLSFVLAFSLLSACSKKPAEKPDDSSSDTIEDDYSNDFDDDYSDDDYSDEDYSDEDDYYDDEYSDEWIPEVQIYNGQAPINTKYRGHSGTVYHGYGYMLDDKNGRVYTDEERALEADRLANAGIKFVRTRYTTYWVWNSTSQQWNFNSDRFNYFCNYLKAMQDRGIEVVLHIGWHHNFFIPGANNSSIGEVSYMKGEGPDKFGESAGYNFNGLDEDSTRLIKASHRMGYFYYKSILEFRARGLNNTSNLLYFVEPSYGNDQNPTGNQAAEYYLMCSTIKAYLESRPELKGTLTHIGTNQGSIRNPGLLKYCMDRDPDLFTIWTTHYYPVAENATDNVIYDLMVPVIEAYLQPLKDHGIYGKKEFWYDEFDVSDKLDAGGANGLYGTVSSSWLGLQNIVGYLTGQQMGVNNFLDWQFADQLWTDQTNTSSQFFEGIHMCGFTPSLFHSTIPYQQYYYVYLFSRYNGYQNGTVYKTNIDEYYVDGLYSGAVVLEDGNWTITIVNLGSEELEFNVYLEKAINKTLYRHLEASATTVCTTAARLADADKTYLNVKDKFTDTIPAGSVAIYTSVKG